jgi:hypothetical protein
MLEGEISIEKAKELSDKESVFYVVVDKNNNIIKCFINSNAWKFAEDNELKCHNITHPKCPRSVKIQLNWIRQYDLFLDIV